MGLSEDEDIGDTSVDMRGSIEGGPGGFELAPLLLPPPPMDCCMRQ